MRLFKVLMFYSFMCLCVYGHAQKTIKTTSLLKQIPNLEQRYNHQFNYIESNVHKEVFLDLGLTLQETLDSLERQTQLRFEIVGEKQIIIRDFKPTDLISVCGYVTNDNFPRVGVRVSPVMTLIPVYTNENGFFELNDIPYESNIVFRSEDFFLHSTTIADLFMPECVTIEVSMFSEELEEVTLKNYLTKGVSKQDQKISIVSTKFSVLPGIVEPDVMKSLEHIPSVQSPFETPSKLYVRGSTPDQNLVLWNGIRTYNPSHFFGLISAINPYTVEKTDFYAKGVKAKYGGRLAGVIDMKSANAVYNEFSGGVGVNLISADVFANIPLFKDKLSVNFSARRSYTDVLKTSGYTPMAERIFQNLHLEDEIKKKDDEFSFFDYSFGIQAKPSKKDALQFNALYAQDKLTFKSYAPFDSFTDNLSTQNEGYSAQWQHKYTNKIEQQTVVSLSNYSLDYLLESEDLITSGQVNETKINFINDYGGQTFLKFNFNKRTHLQLGYQYSVNSIRYKIDNETDDFVITLDEQKNKLETHSIFTEYEINLNSKALFQLGLRANKYSTDNELFIEPRFYTEIALFPKFKLNSTITLTSQAITQIQESITNNSTLENLLWRITDDNEFNVLISQQYSTGVTYKNKNWFLEGDFFYKLTENLTTLTAGFLSPLGGKLNSGKNKTLGGELFIKKKFKNYSSWVSYAFTNQESQFDSINNGAYFISNLNVEHTFKWQHYYQLNDFQFSLGWLWHSGRATTNVTANKEEGKPVELLYTDLNAQNLPVYRKLDFSALYSFKLKQSQNTRYQVGVSVQNIYNRKSVLNREFRTTPGINNELRIVDYNSLGFTPNVSLRVFW